jgi:mRNA interferase YafQ
MLQPSTTNQFEKDKRKALEQKRDLSPLLEVMDKLIREQPLEPKYCDHPLKGEWKGFKQFS